MSKSSLILDFPRMKNELKKEIEKKFLTSERFCQDIEELVLREKINYIDAIILYCLPNH